MKCSNCGSEIPAGRGFCPKCGNMASFGAASQAASEPNKGKRNTAAVGTIGQNKRMMLLIFSVIAVLALVLIVLAVNLMKEEINPQEEVDIHTEIIGYWESFNKIKVGDMLVNILVEGDFSESEAKAVASALGLKDEKIKVNLVFYDDQTLRIGFGGNFVGDKANMTYELITDDKLILNYSGKLHLPSVNVLGVDLGLGDKDIKIAHTFQYEYDAEDNVLSIEIFGEKIRLKKDK